MVARHAPPPPKSPQALFQTPPHTHTHPETQTHTHTKECMCAHTETHTHRHTHTHTHTFESIPAQVMMSCLVGVQRAGLATAHTRMLEVLVEKGFASALGRSDIKLIDWGGY